MCNSLSNGEKKKKKLKKEPNVVWCKFKNNVIVLLANFECPYLITLYATYSIGLELELVHLTLI